MKFKQSSYILLSLIISIVLVFIYFILVGFYNYISFNYLILAVILSFIPLILSLIELLIYKRKRFAKFFWVLLFTIFIVIFGFIESEDVPTDQFYATTAFIFNFPIIITLIVSLIKTKKIEKKFGLTPKIEEMGSVYVHTGKGLPIGWIDNKTFKKNKIVTYIIAIISIMLIVLTAYIEEPALTTLIAACSCVILLSSSVIINHKDYQVIFDFEKTLENFDNVKKFLFEKAELEDVHPETRNYMIILYANYAGLFSKTDREVAMSMCKVPTYITYRLLYDTLLYIKDELTYEEAKEYLDKLFNDPYYNLSKGHRKKADKIYNKLLHQNDVVHNKVALNEEKDFPFIKNNKVSQLSSYYSLFKCYYNRQNYEKAKEYKQKIYDLGGNCTQLIENVNKYELD